MIRTKLILLKDKQVFSKDKGIMRLLGKPIDIAKKLKKEGIELLHIVDSDAANGLRTNFDVYDKLTYCINIEVECGENEELIEKLLKINARVVLTLPAKKIDIRKFADKKRLLVGKIDSKFDGDVEEVYDVIIENATIESVKKFAKLKKRVLIFEKDLEVLETSRDRDRRSRNYKKEMEKMVFGVIG